MKIRKYLLFVFILLGLFGISFSQNLKQLAELDACDLVAAVNDGDIDSVRALMAGSNKQERNRAYLAAAKKCKTDIAEELIANGADPNELSIYDVKHALDSVFLFSKVSKSRAKSLVYKTSANQN